MSLDWSKDEHTHDPTKDSFIYHLHKDKQLNYAPVIARSVVHRGTAPYTTSAKLLRTEGLPVLSKEDFYNLKIGADRGEKLSRHKEIAMVMAYLEEGKFHVDVRAEYLLDGFGNCI